MKPVLLSLFIIALSVSCGSLEDNTPKDGPGSNTGVKTSIIGFSTTYRASGEATGGHTSKHGYDRATGNFIPNSSQAADSNIISYRLHELKQAAIALALDAIDLTTLLSSYEPILDGPLDYDTVEVIFTTTAGSNPVRINSLVSPTLPPGLKYIYDISRYDDFWQPI